MDFLSWMGLSGALLLVMALTSAYVRDLPVTTSAIYLGFGLVLGPAVLGLVELDFVAHKSLLEHLTETAVIVSLFVGGLKLRLPLLDAAWAAAYRLAGPVMVASIAGVAVFAHFLFGFEWPFALLLGAVLAPTDPVLASTVSVNDAADHDRMRYGLSGEAGFNDGAAFPFVVFALLWAENDALGSWTGEWALSRLLWAVPAGLLGGYFLGKGVGRLAIWLRSRNQDAEAPNDFLALALIALAYFGAESIGAWGFLAAFAAGLGFRRAEIRVVQENPLPESAGETTPGVPVPHPPAEHITGNSVKEEELSQPVRAAGVVVSEIISFGNTAERLFEVVMVVLLGIGLATYWDWRAIPLALALFFLIRPAATMLFLAGSPATRLQRLMMAWFGIRGIGSLYYLAYALNHGLSDHISDAVSLTISVVALSILLHGISSQPLLNAYERAISRTKT